jgi:hypothetical protein
MAKNKASNGKGASRFKGAIAASNGTAPGHKLIERKRYTQALDVKADAEEVRKMAEEMADLQIRKNAIESEKREANAEFREDLAGIKDQLTKLATQVKGHTKTEEVECVEMLDEATGEIRVMRTDTNEQIEFRAATKEDLQENMFPPEPKGRKKKATASEATAP